MSDAANEAMMEDGLTDGLQKKSLSGKKILIMAGAVIALLVLIGVAVSFLTGGEDTPDPTIDAELDAAAQQEALENRQEQLEADAPPEKLALLFIHLDSKVYNLNTGGDGSSFLNVDISLEVDRESYKADIEAKMPRILDELNTYMRELRPSDLEGAAGIFRLKEELLLRINQAVAPSRVKDVLLQEFLIQGTK